MITSHIIILVTFGVLLSVALYVTFRVDTWTGILVDGRHCPQNKESSHANCGVNAFFCLLTPDKEYHVLLQPPPSLTSYIGQPVRVMDSKR